MFSRSPCLGWVGNNEFLKRWHDNSLENQPAPRLRVYIGCVGELAMDTKAQVRLGLVAVVASLLWPRLLGISPRVYLFMGGVALLAIRWPEVKAIFEPPDSTRED
jgi:hypothetical protein